MPKSNKTISTLVMLVILVGIIFWGIGHFYIGNTLKGVSFLFADIALVAGIAFGLTVVGPALLILVVVGLIGWVYQGLDAYDLAKNQGMQW